MAESTESLTRVDTLLALRRYLQYARTGTLTDDQNADLVACVKFGENAFYKGTRLPGEETVHQWSFLQPILTLAITSGIYTYDLPDDFAGFSSSFLWFGAADVPTNEVTLIGIDQLNEHRSLYPNETPRLPTEAAYVLKTRAQSTGQRFALQLFPTPQDDCTLYGRYYSNPQITVDSTGVYPLGGQPHGLTLVEACLAAAELHMNDESQGPHWREFMRLMIDSVAFDRAQTTPKHFGKNVDRSQHRRPYRRHRANGVEYIGGF